MESELTTDENQTDSGLDNQPEAATGSENEPQQAAPKPKKPKKSFGTFTLFDNFAICHYDMTAAFHKTDKKFLDAVTVGHVLRRGFIDTRGKNSLARARGGKMLEAWDELIREGLMKVYEQHQAIEELYEQDPIDHGELFTGEGVTLDIHWNDQRFFYLVRMALMLDEANTRLRKLLNSGFIDKNTMKRKQRALAQPYRATLHGVTSMASKIHKEFKKLEEEHNGGVAKEAAQKDESAADSDQTTA
ncbi:MAG: hypothetical protein HKM24_06315 [Gammaproteobacteria bacterium]|nr:hypothetical protein [Gammaproteobacteria bacterium]